ncbi:sodium/potassium/calcium exchanger Nckx30C-like isoform X2 [Symsagittifera roscoffensis]|uniref:sodium/potassium/calcium exchanger Nckx30C-like isoform X2 n=1 Tax=Symsagittifera roscoffensis TaxID=84072 RepID=UPI00307B5ABA
MKSILTGVCAANDQKDVLPTSFHLAYRQKKRKVKLWVTLSLIAIILLAAHTLSGGFQENNPLANLSADQPIGSLSYSSRHLLSETPADQNSSHSSEDEDAKLPWESCSLEKDSQFTYLWLLLWALLTFWLFIALAIICDDFFVPSLEEISDRLNLTEDVAGATFMAAGSSAPELFTSLSGVFVKSDVGIGTIVGSAIFNLLIIIALSAALAGKVLHIDWRPLSRDALFYSLSIICFIVFCWDGQIEVWEAAGLFSLYIVYVTLMFFNPHIMNYMNIISCCCSKVVPQQPAQATEDNVSKSDDQDHKFKHTAQLNGLGTRKSSNTSQAGTVSLNGVGANQSNAAEGAGSNPPPGNTDQQDTDGDGEEEEDDEIKICSCMPGVPMAIPSKDSPGFVANVKFLGAWILFVLAFPWAILFAWTVPNCGKPHLKKYYLVSFMMSLFWIGFCSFAMVFLVGRAGCALDIQQFVMGLVIVAVGTSVPDALSSVIVARDGFGDMAVSNAIGSNVFDIDLGLGLPFLVRMLFMDQLKPIQLLSADEKAAQLRHNNPLIPHVKFGFILFFILVLCYLVFIAVRFRLNRFVGVTFVIMYVLFIIYALVQEFACDEGFAC